MLKKFLVVSLALPLLTLVSCGKNAGQEQVVKIDSKEDKDERNHRINANYLLNKIQISQGEILKIILSSVRGNPANPNWAIFERTKIVDDKLKDKEGIIKRFKDDITKLWGILTGRDFSNKETGKDARAIELNKRIEELKKKTKDQITSGKYDKKEDISKDFSTIVEGVSKTFNLIKSGILNAFKPLININKKANLTDLSSSDYKVNLNSKNIEFLMTKNPDLKNFIKDLDINSKERLTDRDKIYILAAVTNSNFLQDYEGRTAADLLRALISILSIKLDDLKNRIDDMKLWLLNEENKRVKKDALLINNDIKAIIVKDFANLKEDINNFKTVAFKMDELNRRGQAAIKDFNRMINDIERLDKDILEKKVQFGGGKITVKQMVETTFKDAYQVLRVFAPQQETTGEAGNLFISNLRNAITLAEYEPNFDSITDLLLNEILLGAIRGEVSYTNGYLKNVLEMLKELLPKLTNTVKDMRGRLSQQKTQGKGDDLKQIDLEIDSFVNRLNGLEEILTNILSNKDKKQMLYNPTEQGLLDRLPSRILRFILKINALKIEKLYPLIKK